MDIEVHSISNMIIIEYLLLPLVIFSFVILMIPVVGQANEKMINAIGTYKDTVMKEMPDDVKESVENITDEIEKYKTIDDIGGKITTNIENLSLLNGS